MGDFQKVTLGSGVIKWDNVDVGYLKSPVSYEFKVDEKELETGTPLKLQGSIVTKFEANLVANMLEIKAENASIALGGLAITTIDGSQVTKTDQSLTFAVLGSGGLQAIILDGGNIASGGDKPVVKHSSGSPTYLEDADYIVDYTLGIIYRIPTGDIASAETTKNTYKYTPPASKKIKLGTISELSVKELEFVHTNPNTGKEIKVYMPKAKATRDFKIEFNDTDFVALNVTFKAVDDTANNPTCPLGYINFAT